MKVGRWASPIRSLAGRSAAPVVGRLFVAILAAILVASSTSEPAQARQRSTVNVLREYQLISADAETLTICVDESQTVGFKISRIVEYTVSGSSRVHQAWRKPGRREIVKAAVQDASIVEVSPPLRALAPPQAESYFDVKGLKAGTTKLALSDGLHHEMVDETVTIHVHDCEYEVSLTSIWQLSFGFNPTLYATLDDVKLKRVRENVYSGQGKMQNTAVGQGLGSCGVSFSVPPSDVLIKATIVPGTYRPQVELNVSYDQVKATTHACGGTAENTADVAFIKKTMPAWDSFATATANGHLLETQGGTSQSDTDIALKLVRH